MYEYILQYDKSKENAIFFPNDDVNSDTDKYWDIPVSSIRKSDENWISKYKKENQIMKDIAMLEN